MKTRSIIVLSILLFVNCQTEIEDRGTLNGAWTNEAHGFITNITINTAEKTLEYEDSYKGIIANSPDFTSVNGVLIIQFTEYWEWDYSNFPDVTRNENLENIGKFGALYWKDLKSNLVYLADAYTYVPPTDYIHTLFDDLEAAKRNFTLDNVGSYIDWSVVSPYTK